MSYRLKSLNLSTWFDEPISRIAVPGVASHGSSTALCLVDGASRGRGRLARLVTEPALLGLRVDHHTAGVRVHVQLLVDDASTRLWARRRRDETGEPAKADEVGRHRLVQVSVQGRPRAVALLARRAGRPAARDSVSVDVAAAEIGSTGTLMLGFDPVPRPPAWAERSALPEPLLGLCVARVRLEPLTADPVAARASVDRPGSAALVSSRRPGFFVVNPGCPPGPVELVLTARQQPAPHRSRSGRSRSGRSRSGRSRSRLRAWVAGLRTRVARAREFAADPPRPRARLEVVGLDGVQTVSTTVDPDAAGVYRLVLPRLDQPVLVRARAVRAPSAPPQAAGWGVEVRPG